MLFSISFQISTFLSRSLFRFFASKPEKKKEVVELWQIAPKYDQQTLRENYLTGKIFRIGDIVETETELIIRTEGLATQAKDVIL